MTDIINLSPDDLYVMLSNDEVVLVDVREDNEFAAERIPGALSFPLSTLNPADLPAGKTIVLSCAGGVRSVKAAALCQIDGLDINQHLAGGLNAWKAAGLPTER